MYSTIIRLPPPLSQQASRGKDGPCDNEYDSKARARRLRIAAPVNHPVARRRAALMKPEAAKPPRYVCIHGHFYQPPRESPWLDIIEVQDSAHPFHDWNERITAECYGPNAAARIL